MYHFNLVPKMGLAECLSFYHQAPKHLIQIRESEIHSAAMLKSYI